MIFLNSQKTYLSTCLIYSSSVLSFHYHLWLRWFFSSVRYTWSRIFLLWKSLSSWIKCYSSCLAYWLFSVKTSDWVRRTGCETLIRVSFLLSCVWKKFKLPGKAIYPYVSAEFSRKAKKSSARVDCAGVSFDGGQPKAKIMFSPPWAAY